MCRSSTLHHDFPSGLPSQTKSICYQDFQVHSGCAAPKPQIFSIRTSKSTAVAPLQNHKYFQSRLPSSQRLLRSKTKTIFNHDFQVHSGCSAPKPKLFSIRLPSRRRLRRSKANTIFKQFFQVEATLLSIRTCKSANTIFNQDFQVDSGCAAPKPTLFSTNSSKSTAAAPLQKQHYFQSGLASPQRLRRSRSNTIFNQDLQVHSGYAAPKPTLFSIRTCKSIAATPLQNHHYFQSGLPSPQRLYAAPKCHKHNMTSQKKHHIASQMLFLDFVSFLSAFRIFVLTSSLTCSMLTSRVATL